MALAKKNSHFIGKTNTEILDELQFNKFKGNELDSLRNIINENLGQAKVMAKKEFVLTSILGLANSENPFDMLYTMAGGFEHQIEWLGEKVGYEMSESHIKATEDSIFNVAVIILPLVFAYFTKTGFAKVREDNVKELNDIMKSKYILLNTLHNLDITDDTKLYLEKSILEGTQHIPQLNKTPDLNMIKLIINIFENKLENINNNLDNYRGIHTFKQAS